ncbi:MAG: hypothetical protein KBD47_00755, partial [Candidatus Pacebacteria bacterium]|nr:hypothetical protein [Candidatus Paceibacterota bacterium]
YFIAKEIEFLGRKALLQEKMTVVGKDNFGSYKQLLIPGEKYFYYIDYKEKSDVFNKIFESFKLIDQE